MGKFIRGHSPEEAEIREAARSRGEKYYFFPRPCLRGHISKRQVRNTYCQQCHNEVNHERRKERHSVEPEFRLYEYARERAKNGGVEFAITQSDIRAVWPKDNRCPILGIKLEANQGECGPQRQSPSLDRVNPNKGYVLGNIAVISYKANCIKQNETDPKVFEAMATWLREHQN